MDRYAQLQLLMHRWLAQIDLVAPGGPSKEAKAVDDRPKSEQYRIGRDWRSGWGYPEGKNDRRFFLIMSKKTVGFVGEQREPFPTVPGARTPPRNVPQASPGHAAIPASLGNHPNTVLCPPWPAKAAQTRMLKYVRFSKDAQPIN